VPSPFDCWLVLRGIRTLPYRMRAHSENALKVATFLHGHARVEAVHYPGLPTHPAHDVARRQMAAFGGMLSVQVRGDQARAMQVAAKLRVFTRATSFGGRRASSSIARPSRARARARRRISCDCRSASSTRTT
jgi:cystathionine gamma-synthase